MKSIGKFDLYKRGMNFQDRNTLNRMVEAGCTDVEEIAIATKVHPDVVEKFMPKKKKAAKKKAAPKKEETVEPETTEEAPEAAEGLDFSGDEK